jgi:hypothetical protein
MQLLLRTVKSLFLNIISLFNTATVKGIGSRFAHIVESYLAQQEKQKSKNKDLTLKPTQA